MKDTAASSRGAQTESRPAREAIPLTERLGYSPAEFGGLFGRSPTWAYRQLYSGKVKAISNAGRLLIPRVELDAFLARATEYNPKLKPKTQNQQARQASAIARFEEAANGEFSQVHKTPSRKGGRRK